MGASAGSISVVVFAYRNEGSILQAVDSVVRQEPAEVIVVTSGGDRSGGLLRERYPDVLVVESERRLLPGAARNRGTALAGGEVIAFLEGDCLAEPGWVARRVVAHRSGHRAVASAVTNAGPHTAAGWAAYYLGFAARQPGRDGGRVRPPDARAHGMSFDRALLEEIGPFPEDVRVGEDTEAARRLADRGIEIWYEPAVRTAHLGPAGLQAMVRDQFRRGRQRARAVPMPLAGRGRRRVLGASLRAGFRRLRWILRNSLAFETHRWRPITVLPWIVAGALANQVGWTRERFLLLDLPRPLRRGPPEAVMGGAVGLAAGVTYLGTSLLGGPRLTPAVLGAGLTCAAAVASVYAASRALEGSRPPATVGAVAFGVAPAVWMAAAGGGKAAVPLLASAVSWLAGSFHLRRASPVTGFALGAALVLAASVGGPGPTVIPSALLIAVAGVVRQRNRRVPLAGGVAAGILVAAGIAVTLGASGTVRLPWETVSPRGGDLGDLGAAVAAQRPLLLGVRGPVTLLVGVRFMGALLAPLLLLSPVLRGLVLLVRGGSRPVAGAALLVHAAIALAWGLTVGRLGFATSLVPVAMLWSAGGSVLIPPSVPRGRWFAVLVAAGLLALAAWNLRGEVLPGLAA
jgi:glycosyltransferase involved in cell wall biosynthesis